MPSDKHDVRALLEQAVSLFESEDFPVGCDAWVWLNLSREAVSGQTCRCDGGAWSEKCTWPKCGLDPATGTTPSHVAPKCVTCNAILESSGRCPNQWYHESRSSIPSATLCIEALRKIANDSPREESSIHGPRLRCWHCSHAWRLDWNNGAGEPEHHGERCAYVIAKEALRRTDGGNDG